MHFSFPKNLLLIGLSVAIVILLMWDILLLALQYKTTLYNYWYNVAYAFLYIASGSIALYGSKSLAGVSKTSRGLLFLGLATVSYGIGLLIWAYFNLALQVEVPYPSIADLFFILFYPLLAAGIFVTLDIFKLVLTRRMVIEGIVAGIIAGFFILLTNPPNLTPNADLLERIFNLAYPLADIFLISLIYIAAKASSGKTHIGLILLIIAMIGQTIGDYLFSINTSAGTYFNGDISDLMYTLTAYFLGVGIVYIIWDLSSILQKEN